MEPLQRKFKGTVDLDFTSIKVLPHPEHLSTSWPGLWDFATTFVPGVGTCFILSISVPPGLSFKALTPPLSLGLEYILRGWMNGWMDDREWKESTMAEPLLGPFSFGLAFLNFAFSIYSCICCKQWACRGLCCNCLIGKSQFSIPSHALGSYKCYLTMSWTGIKYCQASTVREYNLAVCTSSGFVKLAATSSLCGKTEPELFSKFQWDGNFGTPKRQRTSQRASH